MRSVWILTREENQYDQYGEYFDAVFFKFPSKEDLLKTGLPASVVEHVLTKGGRIGREDTWWELTEYKEPK